MLLALSAQSLRGLSLLELAKKELWQQGGKRKCPAWGQKFSSKASWRRWHLGDYKGRTGIYQVTEHQIE